MNYNIFISSLFLCTERPSAQNGSLTLWIKYKLRVAFDRTNYKPIGIRDFFVNHGLIVGENLIFECVSMSNFNVLTLPVLYMQVRVVLQCLVIMWILFVSFDVMFM